jgi:putative FmdB family regulatory protein
MPIYEYRCDSCGHEFETIQKVSEAPLQTCPECETTALVKKVSAAGFRLKGGGWYETDFKSGNKRNVSGDKPESTESSTSSSSTEGKSASSGDTGSSPGKSSSEKTAPSTKKPD